MWILVIATKIGAKLDTSLVWRPCCVVVRSGGEASWGQTSGARRYDLNGVVRVRLRAQADYGRLLLLLR